MKINAESLGCRITADPGETLTDCDRQEVVQLLRDCGWVFFSGFNTTLREFDVFTSSFGDCEEIRGVHYPPGGEALGFHAEDAYNPYRPDALWFVCLFEGSDGGSPTGVVDGVAMFSALPPQWQEFARASNLRFDRQWSAATWQAATGSSDAADVERVLERIPGISYEFLPDGALYVGYEVPLVVRTPRGDESFSNTLLQAVTEPAFYGMALSDGSPVPEELVVRARELALQGETDLGWSAHDVVVIDNHRMMHRRGEYSGKDRDLRARHCRNLFGSAFPETTSRIGEQTKRLLQGDEGDPVRVGRPELGYRGVA